MAATLNLTRLGFIGLAGVGLVSLVGASPAVAETRSMFVADGGSVAETPEHSTEAVSSADLGVRPGNAVNSAPSAGLDVGTPVETLLAPKSAAPVSLPAAPGPSGFISLLARIVQSSGDGR